MAKGKRSKKGKVAKHGKTAAAKAKYRAYLAEKRKLIRKFFGK